jgi:hypothetical protein
MSDHKSEAAAKLTDPPKTLRRSIADITLIPLLE